MPIPNGERPGGVYGILIFLGYRSGNPERNTQFVLRRRERPNGLKFTVIVSDTPKIPPPGTLLRRYSRRLLKDNHGIEFRLERSDDHDIFQFGRDPDNNDFHLPCPQIEGRNRFNPLESLLIDAVGPLTGRFMSCVTGRHDRSIFMQGVSIHQTIMS
jgi:hypothetical protein